MFKPAKEKAKRLIYHNYWTSTEYIEDDNYAWLTRWNTASLKITYVPVRIFNSKLK